MLTILLLLAAPADTTTLMKAASRRLAAGCVGEACTPVVKPSPYRITGDADADTGDRMTIDDGSKCSVVGGRICTRRPRTMLRATLDR